MNPYYQDDWTTIYHGDSREVLPSLPKASAIVTDPPYGLGFMGKKWDTYDPTVNRGSFRVGTGTHPRGYVAIKKPEFQEFCYQWATACLQATLTGAPMLAFGGTRTFHRMACAIEDAGWELRDTLGWIYFQGFPKSLDIGKAIDKVLGHERPRTIKAEPRSTLHGDRPWIQKAKAEGYYFQDNNPISKESAIWEGYGTALKPAYEPIILAMSPLDGTFANNALTHGVAGLNIGECRVGTEEISVHNSPKGTFAGGEPNRGSDTSSYRSHQGRFPANLIIDDSPEVAGIFPNNNGSAARFFYCAKASKSERDRGCEALPMGKVGHGNLGKSIERFDTKGRNTHPTVKPLALMTYLVKLVKMPEYNLVVDPFCGTGTTLMACIRLGIPCIGIDTDEHTCEIAALRCIREASEQIDY